MSKKVLLIPLILAILVSLFVVVPLALAGEEACDTRVNNTFAKLLECVTLEGVREHQAALQGIVDANGGTRVRRRAGLRPVGGLCTASFLRCRLSRHPSGVPIPNLYRPCPADPRAGLPAPAGPIANNILSYSGSGDVTAAVHTLAAPPVDATPGCEAADFAGFPAGNIALINRGACTFAIKATNAYNAGR